MAPTQGLNLSPYSATSNTAPSCVTRKMAATQGTPVAGTPFYQNTSGTMTLSDTSDGTGDTYQYVLRDGIETELAVNTERRFYQISTAQLWQVNVENNDSDAAATQALIGNQYGLTVQTGATPAIGYTTVDVNNANAAVQVVDIFPNLSEFDPNHGTTSDSPGIAIVRFLESVIAVTRSA